MIPRNDLAKIWYRSLRKLPSDATYEDCRNAIVLAMVELNYNSKIMEVKELFG